MASLQAMIQAKERQLQEMQEHRIRMLETAAEEKVWDAVEWPENPQSRLLLPTRIERWRSSGASCRSSRTTSSTIFSLDLRLLSHGHLPPHAQHDPAVALWWQPHAEGVRTPAGLVFGWRDDVRVRGRVGGGAGDPTLTPPSPSPCFGATPAAKITKSQFKYLYVSSALMGALGSLAVSALGHGLPIGAPSAARGSSNTLLHRPPPCCAVSVSTQGSAHAGRIGRCHGGNRRLLHDLPVSGGEGAAHTPVCFAAAVIATPLLTTHAPRCLGWARCPPTRSCCSCWPAGS